MNGHNRRRPLCGHGAHRVCLLLSFWAGSIGTCQQNAIEPSSLREKLDRRRIELKVPGALVGVYQPGRPDLEFALGLADVERRTPASWGQSFRIASLSKVFVGQLILILAGDGKLELDDPVARYVPNVPGGEQITIRHLANHRSGLFNHIESPKVKAAFAKEPSRWWSIDELLGYSFEHAPYFPPGAAHHYSNANTVLLAKIAEQVSGRPWEEELRARVLIPLNMTQSLIPAGNELPTPHLQGYALAGKEGPFFHRGSTLTNVTATSPSWWGPAGSMISTMADLKKAAKALATGALLKPDMYRELVRWTPADQAGFEYGFHIERVRGGIGHDGDVPGYQTCMYYFPSRDATLLAVTNLYGWSVPDMPADRLAWLAAQETGLVDD